MAGASSSDRLGTGFPLLGMFIFDSKIASLGIGSYTLCSSYNSRLICYLVLSVLIFDSINNEVSIGLVSWLIGFHRLRNFTIVCLVRTMELELEALSFEIF